MLLKCCFPRICIRLNMNSLTEPTGANPLVVAVGWLQSVMLGTIGSSISIIAVAAIGMMMLAGQLPLRRGSKVLLGCFILFGASSVASGIRGAVDAAFGSVDTSSSVSPVEPSPLSETLASQPNYDPYAGASVPDR